MLIFANTVNGDFSYYTLPHEKGLNPSFAAYVCVNRNKMVEVSINPYGILLGHELRFWYPQLSETWKEICNYFKVYQLIKLENVILSSKCN